MTILYFADTRFPIERANGAQTMATCHALAALGHEVTLVVRPDTATPPRNPFKFYGLRPEHRLAIIHVPDMPGRRARRARFLLAAAARAARSRSVVCTRDLGLASFLVQLPRARRPPLVYESHGVADVVAREMPRLLGNGAVEPSETKLRRLARREERVWTRAAAYVTITQTLADELAVRFGARERVFVVPDGAAEVSGPPRADEAAGGAPPVIGYAGHLYPWKGVDVLVRAIALCPEGRGLIVGGHPREADLERIRTMARDLGVADRVEFTGLIPPAEVAGRLAAASILVVPNTASAISERYTSPLKLFEYLQLGRAIIASDLPAIREVLTDGQTALLVSPGDPDALAAAIKRLITDPVLRQTIAAGAHALAPTFTWGTRAQRLEAALEAARS